MKGWKKVFHANTDQKEAGVAILISDKIDFKIKAKKRDKEGHYIKKRRRLHMLSTRDPPQNRGHIHNESEVLEKDIPCK